MPQAAVAAVLLQHARLAFGEALRQLAAELLQRRIEPRVGAPAQGASLIEDFLRVHLQDQVRMRAHEHAVARHVAQERIEPRAVAVLADRVDPDEYAVDAQELPAHLVSGLVGVDCRLDVEADVAQRLRDAVEPGLLEPHRPPRVRLAGKHQRHPVCAPAHLVTLASRTLGGHFADCSMQLTRSATRTAPRTLVTPHPAAMCYPTSGRSMRAPPEAYHAEMPPRMKRASTPRSMRVFVTLRPTSK